MKYPTKKFYYIEGTMPIPRIYYFPNFYSLTNNQIQLIVIIPQIPIHKENHFQDMKPTPSMWERYSWPDSDMPHALVVKFVEWLQMVSRNVIIEVGEE